MKSLYLSDFTYVNGLNPQVDGNSIDYEILTFKGGEPHITIQDPATDSVIIRTRLTSFEAVGELLIATDALRRSGVKHISLDCGYFPGARQDRVANRGEALTVKVYADLINAQGYEKVYVTDPHSEVTPALLNNCEVVLPYNFYDRVMLRTVLPVEPSSLVIQWIDREFMALVAPDAGASKKMNGYAQHRIKRGYTVQTVQALKHRDTKTGNLTGFEVLGDVPESCIILDDICDGGGTFIGLAKVLKEKGATDIALAVTHGIFSGGTSELHKVFSSIHSTDSFLTAAELVAMGVKVH